MNLNDGKPANTTNDEKPPVSLLPDEFNEEIRLIETMLPHIHLCKS